MWNLNGQPIDRRVLNAFTDSLAHRGPDGRGTYVDDSAGIALGHRRLAIIDTHDTGRQPMSYSSKRYWISYNGEIYNFIELRKELESNGHRFRTESDTEIILASYAHWGEECQLRFNGMWAFAIWDARDRRLFLSRDRFGVKPLFYAIGPMLFAFASEVKAFLTLSWVDKGMDPETVALALDDPSLIDATEWCLMAGAKRLLGGHSITIQQSGTRTIRCWWDSLERLPSVPECFEEQAEGFRNLFLDACRIRMRSDVAVCFSLSGGIDSSSILSATSFIRGKDGLGNRTATNSHRAFIASFPGTTQDEMTHARTVIRHTGATPIEFVVKAGDLLENLDTIIFQQEELYWEIPIGPWMLYRAQRANGVYVSLDGHGGDETLAGYPHYVIEAMRDAMHPWPHVLDYWSLRQILRRMYPAGTNKKLPRFTQLVREENMFPIRDRLEAICRHLNLKMMPSARDARNPFRRCDASAYMPDWMFAKPRSHSLAARLPREPRLDKLDIALWRDTHMATLPSILRIFDRSSMAHGVEVRCPFLDWRLVCYAFALPSQSKIGDGFTKRILRAALKGILPESTRTRRQKIGFAAPLDAWLRSPLRDLMLDSTSSKSFIQSDVWNGQRIRADLEDAYKSSRLDVVAQALRYVVADRLSMLFKDKTSIPELVLNAPNK